MPAEDPTRTQLDFLASFAALREQLACPACHEELVLEESNLHCGGCGRSYPIVDGIPALIPGAAQAPTPLR